jgi:hypothetical protein
MREPCLDPELVEICDDCCGTVFEGMDPALVEQIKRMALYYLWVATGRQFGLCEVTYRPCRKDCRNLTGHYPLPYPSIPYKLNGSWFNLSCGKCPGACGCDFVSEVFLQHTYAVLNIREDGIDIDPLGTVAVYDYERIIRVDGAEWPSCQNLSSEDGPGTWSITVLQGKQWPDGLGLIAGILACELAKACTGDSGCRLPQRVQTITRQNVTVGFQDRFEGLAQMHTGLWEVDSFIEATRWTGFTSASITSPDWPEAPIMTWPNEDTSPLSPGDSL